MADILVLEILICRKLYCDGSSLLHCRRDLESRCPVASDSLSDELSLLNLSQLKYKQTSLFMMFYPSFFCIWVQIWFYNAFSFPYSNSFPLVVLIQFLLPGSRCLYTQIAKLLNIFLKKHSSELVCSCFHSSLLHAARLHSKCSTVFPTPPLPNHPLKRFTLLTFLSLHVLHNLTSISAFPLSIRRNCRQLPLLWRGRVGG